MGPLSIQRKDLLIALIKSPMKAQEILRDLRLHPHDSDDIVEFTHIDALEVLERFVRGELSANAIRFWAECIEGRDDIGFQIDDLKDFIFELSTPEINFPISPDWAMRWILRLKNDGS